MKGALFVFEGPDGVGKTTLASRVNRYLNDQGFSSALVALPGRKIGTVGEHINRLYHNPRSFGIQHISITTEQLLFMAAHADVIENEILPALLKGTNVLLDRYWWSTWVYSMDGGLDLGTRDLLVELEVKIWRDARPVCIFLVHRDRPRSSEHDDEKWRRLVSLYDELRSQLTASVKIIDIYNNNTLEAATGHIVDEVMRDLTREERN
jgi:dTMP kinase